MPFLHALIIYYIEGTLSRICHSTKRFGTELIRRHRGDICIYIQCIYIYINTPDQWCPFVCSEARGRPCGSNDNDPWRKSGKIGYFNFEAENSKLCTNITSKCSTCQVSKSKLTGVLTWKIAKLGHLQESCERWSQAIISTSLHTCSSCNSNSFLQPTGNTCTGCCSYSCSLT